MFSNQQFSYNIVFKLPRCHPYLRRRSHRRRQIPHQNRLIVFLDPLWSQNRLRLFIFKQLHRRQL